MLHRPIESTVLTGLSDSIETMFLNEID